MAVIEIWTIEGMPMDVTDFDRWSHPEITFDLISALDPPGSGPYDNDAWAMVARWRIEVPLPAGAVHSAERIV